MSPIQQQHLEISFSMLCLWSKYSLTLCWFSGNESVYSAQTSALLEELLGSTDQLLQVTKIPKQLEFVSDSHFNSFKCSQDQYGNYVIQHILDRGRQEHKSRIGKRSHKVGLFHFSFLLFWSKAQNELPSPQIRSMTVFSSKISLFLFSSSPFVLFLFLSELRQWPRGQPVPTQVCKVGNQIEGEKTTLLHRDRKKKKKLLFGIENKFGNVRRTSKYY